MATITLILLVFAFVLEALATFWQPNPPRWNLMAAGFACYFLSVLLGWVHF